jgi:hypothetical protein
MNLSERSSQSEITTATTREPDQLASPGEAASVDAKSASDARSKRLAGAVIAILLVAGIVGFFAVDVCEQKLTNSGSAVVVCRPLQASDPPVLAVGIAVLAVLGVFFTEISALGITLKRIQKMEQRVQATDEKANIAQDNARTADERARLAEDSAQTAQSLARSTTEKLDETEDDLREGLQHVLPKEGLESTPVTERPERQDQIDPKIRELAGEYNRIRWTMSSGPARTAAMEDVVRRMRSAWQSIKDVDVTLYLVSEDRGLRLAGFAYLYENPDPGQIPKLVDVLLKEDKPFGQYWALQALEKQLDAHPEPLDHDTRARLESLLSRLGPGTDRARLLRPLLERAPL